RAPSRWRSPRRAPVRMPFFSLRCLLRPSWVSDVPPRRSRTVPWLAPPGTCVERASPHLLCDGPCPPSSPAWSPTCSDAFSTKATRAGVVGREPPGTPASRCVLVRDVAAVAGVGVDPVGHREALTGCVVREVEVRDVIGRVVAEEPVHPSG